MIDASRKPKVVFYSLCQQLRSITDFRESLFSQCLAVRARQANEMLARGYKQSSRFGRWDPVEVNIVNVFNVSNVTNVTTVTNVTNVAKCLDSRPSGNYYYSVNV